MNYSPFSKIKTLSDSVIAASVFKQNQTVIQEKIKEAEAIFKEVQLLNDILAVKISMYAYSLIPKTKKYDPHRKFLRKMYKGDQHFPKKRVTLLEFFIHQAYLDSDTFFQRYGGFKDFKRGDFYCERSQPDVTHISVSVNPVNRFLGPKKRHEKIGNFCQILDDLNKILKHEVGCFEYRSFDSHVNVTFLFGYVTKRK